MPLGFQRTGPTEAEYSLADSIFNTGNIGNPCHDNFIHEFSEEKKSFPHSTCFKKTIFLFHIEDFFLHHEAHFEFQNINSSLGLCYTHVSPGLQCRSGPC